GPFAGPRHARPERSEAPLRFATHGKRISGTRNLMEPRYTSLNGKTVGMTTVLVVDDEPMVRDVLTRYLERDGHRVVTAADGDAARGMIEREAPSLVLLDVMLP